MPAAAPVAAAAEAAAVGQLQGVNEASSELIAYAPGGLSVLYENQAMRVERVELKAELKLISARVCHLPQSLFCLAYCVLGDYRPQYLCHYQHACQIIHDLSTWSTDHYLSPGAITLNMT